MDSRTMKLQSLSASYSINRSPETFAEMMEEMKSMERFDTTFKNFSERFNLSG